MYTIGSLPRQEKQNNEMRLAPNSCPFFFLGQANMQGVIGRGPPAESPGNQDVGQCQALLSMADGNDNQNRRKHSTGGM